MDDVLGHVVLTVGDENLLPGDAEAARLCTGLRHGARAHQREIRAGLRLGQVHGAGPFARDHVGKISGALLPGAGEQDGLDRAVSEQRTQRERQIGAVDHFDAGGRHQLGQALAAEVSGVVQTLPAAFAKLLEGCLEARGRGDRAIGVMHTALDIATAVQGREHLAAEFGVFFEDRIHRLFGRVLAAGQLVNGGEARQFLDDELHVLDGCGVAHVSLQCIR